jgi:uncharacterized cupredoxin-like copper-binding protein
MKKNTKVTILSIAFAAIALAGCGSAPATNTNTSSTSSSSTAQASATSSATQAASSDVVNLSIKPESKQGSDGKKHDAFVNTDFTLTKGKTVKLVITNYDTNMHTLSSSDLNLNIVIKGASSPGASAVTEQTFTPDKAGTFHWMCMNPCDLKANEWAMTHAGFMQGTITVNS